MRREEGEMRKGGRTRSRRAILVFVFTSPACAVCPPASTGGDSHGGKIRKKVKRKRNSHNQDPEVFFFSFFFDPCFLFHDTHTGKWLAIFRRAGQSCTTWVFKLEITLLLRDRRRRRPGSLFFSATLRRDLGPQDIEARDHF